MKLKWKIQPKPTGRFSSFVTRAWPSAEDETGEARSCIYPEGEGITALRYTAENARCTNIALRVRVRVQSKPEDVARRGPWYWASLKKVFSNLAEAKAGAQAYFELQDKLN